MTRSPIGQMLRPRIVGAAAALLLTACSSATEVAATQSDQPEAPVVVTAATATTEAPPTTVVIDAAVLLSDALASYRNGYAFTATTTVNGQVANVQTGRWLEGSTEMTVSSGDGEVDYVITDQGQWTRLTGGDWEELEGSPPVGFPLDTIGTPDRLQVVDNDGDLVEVLAVYPAAALGFTGDEVAAQLRFVSGTLIEVSFSVETDGVTAESTTTLGPLTDITPVTAPPS